MFTALKEFSHPKNGRLVKVGERITIDCSTAVRMLLKSKSIKKWQKI